MADANLATAQELLRQGRVADVLEAVKQSVKARPADAGLRVFLFQLFCIAGDWPRALTQLGVLKDLDAASLLLVHTYRDVLQCEAFRQEVFAGRRMPLVFGEPEPWVGVLLQSLQALAAGRCEQGLELRGQAFEQAPASGGRIGDEEFEWVADADSRLGPCLELIMNGRYYWVPFGNLRELRIGRPEDLRDLVWIPAELVWANGGEVVGFIPARYPDTVMENDGALLLSRRTEWRGDGGELDVVVGQRMWTTDRGEYPLLDTRQIVLNASAQ